MKGACTAPRPSLPCARGGGTPERRDGGVVSSRVSRRVRPDAAPVQNPTLQSPSRLRRQPPFLIKTAHGAGIRIGGYGLHKGAFFEEDACRNWRRADAVSQSDGAMRRRISGAAKPPLCKGRWHAARRDGGVVGYRVCCRVRPDAALVQCPALQPLSQLTLTAPLTQGSLGAALYFSAPRAKKHPGRHSRPGYPFNPPETRRPGLRGGRSGRS